MNVNDATQSRTDGPARIAMHATSGFGKTTTACHLPGALILGAENGVPRDLGFNVRELHPRTWMDVFDVVHSLTNDRHNVESLAVDTVDWLEPLIHRFVCERDSDRKTDMNSKGHKLESIEDYGYGKGYLATEEEFRKFISALDIMQAKRGIHVCMLMHSEAKTFKNPFGADYDKFRPKPQDRVANVVVEWAENLLFGYFQVDAAKLSEDRERNDKTARAKGIGSGVRIIGAQDCALYRAKNRVGLPPEFELGEDLTTLIAALLGEHVVVKERRSPMREKRDHASERDAARINAIEQSTRPPADPAPLRAAATEHDSTPATRLRRDEPTPARYSDPEPPRVERGSRADVRAAYAVAGAALDQYANDVARQMSVDPAKTEARTFTEPKKNGEASRGARANPPAEMTAHRPGDAAREVALNNARSRAAAMGPKYSTTVDGWIKKAGGDPAKLDKIIEKVNADASANANANA